MDELSKQGIRMERYYTHTVCTPTRLALLTGRYSHLSGFGSAGVTLGPAPFHLPEGTRTLPMALKAMGYSPHMVGKWHLGHTRLKDTPVGPAYGFESFVGMLNGAGGHYSKVLSGPYGTNSAWNDYVRMFPNGTLHPAKNDRHSSKTYSDEAVAVMEAHVARGDKRPMFLYLALQAPHTPNQADDEWLEKCKHMHHPTRVDYCGMVVGADEAIGNTTNAMRRLLGDNTIVVVTSDNGGMLHVGGLNTPLRGGKNTAYEGGVRVVGFATDLTPDKRYLGKPKTFDGLAHIADWMPTLLSIARQGAGEDVALPPDEPERGYGYDLREALALGSASPRTEAVVVLDQHSNVVSYIKLPYKVMVGRLGNDEWLVEPEGRYLMGNDADFLAMLEEHLFELVDWMVNTRDVAFFWHEIIHVVIGQYRKRFSESVDFDDGEFKLGPVNVLEGGIASKEDIPVQLFNILEDPEEQFDLAASHPEVLDDMITALDQHWSTRPPLFDWAMSCIGLPRKEMPAEFCLEGRGLKSDGPMNQRSVNPAAFPCVFEAPSIADDDPLPCGTGNPPLINAKTLFKGVIADMVRKACLYLFVGLLVLVLVAKRLCQCMRSPKPSLVYSSRPLLSGSRTKQPLLSGSRTKQE